MEVLFPASYANGPRWPANLRLTGIVSYMLINKNDVSSVATNNLGKLNYSRSYACQEYNNEASV